MRLIDADSLLLRMEKRADCEPVGHFRTIKRMMKMVAEQPTVDTAKHGHWEFVGSKYENGILYVYDGMQCSNCKEIYVEEMSLYPEDAMNFFSYCPWCGAKMDKEVEE